MTVELHRADPKLRVVAASMLVAAIVVGVVGYALLRQWFEGLSHLPRATAQGQLLTALAWCFGLACLSILALAAYLWHFGTRVLVHGQVPLPGARLLRDTPVVRGEAALRRGRLLQVLGVALFGFAVVFAVVAWRLHASLASSAG